MKKIAVTLIFATFYVSAYCQVTDAEKQLKTITADSVIGWTLGGVININTAQTSLTNWSAGGQSSFSINGLVSLFARNKQEKSLWENYLDIGYGTVKQKETGWRKTDDRIDFTSKYGIKAKEKLYYAGLLNFKTQMTPGYNYPNDSVKISDLFAPAYFLAALGIDYVPSPDFTVFCAPITYKLTLVTDAVLAAEGAFGVDPGKNAKHEFGGYVRSLYKVNLMENISLQTKLELFTNYLESFGAIDVSWETLISMKVNKFISATLSTHLLYDQDVKFEEISDDGNEVTTYYSKVQFKEVLAIGLSMNF
jgi:hypothetical protein